MGKSTLMGMIARNTSAEIKNTWKLRRLMRGNAMSSQPIMSGISQLPNAAIRTGMANQKIITVPCRVMNEL